MNRRTLLFVAATVISGCSGPTFTNLGNGACVPTESIDNYAKAHGVSRAEAKKQMLADKLNK